MEKDICIQKMQIFGGFLFPIMFNFQQYLPDN